MNFYKISNKFFKYALMSALIFSSTITYSFANMIDENVYEIPVSQGVTFKKIEQTFTNGANSVYLTIADLNNSSLNLDLLYNKSTGFTNRKKLSDLDAQNPNAVVSINGDFFSMSSPSYAVGTMIEDGKLISSPSYTGKMATMMVHDMGNIVFDYIPSSVSVRNEYTGQSLEGLSVNKISGTYQNPVLITSEFRKSSIGSNAKLEVTELIVENDIVKEIRVNQASTPLSSNTFAIVASGAKAIEIENIFSVGDRVAIVSSAQSIYQNIKTAIGGGTIILKNGQSTPLTHTIAGKSQRTAVGTTFDNKLIFMVVDGRTSSYSGMNETEVANFMKTLNVKDAMMFDGGGSTEMILNKKIVNSVSTERLIVNGISITNNSARGSLSKLVAVLETQSITQGDRVKLMVHGFDSNMNPIALNNISVSGLGVEYSDAYIIAKQGGEGSITISSQGVSTSIPVKITKIDSYDPYLKESSGSIDFAIVSNASSDKDDILGQAINGKTLELLEKSKLAINVYSQNREFENQIKTRKENITSENQSIKTSTATIVSLNAKNGISSTAKQWDNIKSALDSSSQNIIFIFDSNLNLNTSEKRILRKMINESKKKVFVISFGDSMSSYAEGNASYITITDNSKKNKDYKMLSFRTQNGKLVYSFENVL